MNNQSIQFEDAEKAYVRLEAERIQQKIASFGSEGVCFHCKFQNHCIYSTTKPGCCYTRVECDGYEITVDGHRTYVTKMKYSFEYDEGIKEGVENLNEQT